MKARERICLTADRSKAVPDGHPQAAFLWAAEGDEIPEEAADRFGIVDGKIRRGAAGRKSGPKGEDPGSKSGAGKSGPKGEDKQAKPGLTVNKRRKADD